MPGLQFAVDDRIDDNLADLEVILHSGGEDVSGLNALIGSEGIDEVRIPQALREAPFMNASVLTESRMMM